MNARNKKNKDRPFFKSQKYLDSLGPRPRVEKDRSKERLQRDSRKEVKNQRRDKLSTYQRISAEEIRTVLKSGYVGQTLLRLYVEYLTECEAKVNHRPDWLGGLEIDICFKNFGFEFQGDQHYVPVFGDASLERQKENDKTKRRICREKGFTLIKVDAVDLFSVRIKGLLSKHNLPCHKLFGNAGEDRYLRLLDEEARKYRDIMRDKGCVSVRKKGASRKKHKAEWNSNNL